MDFIKVIAYTLIYLLSLFEIVLIVRAICSWAPYFRESKVNRIATAITEPIVAPIRNLLMRISFVRRCPIDLSFIVLYLFIGMASSVLSAFVVYA
ncbi:MAG: YggT family protein [Clostridia bacterium]|nr:YggT family protein [Clostridia bacterium]MBO5416021.1 YggT family protein [Clostridia bacterium]